MAFRIKPRSDVNKKLNSNFKIVGEIRKSQIVTTYGPGSLVDFPRMSAIIEGIDNWESTLGKHNFEKMKIHERNLERILGKDFFVQPQFMENRISDKGITARRFPEYCYCPECGALDKYYRIEKRSNNSTPYNRESYCGLCSQSKNRNVKLIPSGFVISCKCGHLDEFPYDWWVHRKKGKCGNSKLSIEISKTISGLGGILIKCQCGAEETLEGVMDRGALYQRRCYGAMPWLGKKDDMRSWYSDLTDGEPCEEELRVLQRGANNVYYSCVVSALTIPPYSSRIQRFLAGDIEKFIDYNNKPENLKKANLDYYYEKHKGRLRCTREQFVYEVGYALGLTSEKYTSLRELVYGEYNALCDQDCSDQDFLTLESPVPDKFAHLISQIKIVGRLREVQVLQGFKRIAPDEGITAPLSKKPLNWLPANELYGEGIFIRLDEGKVEAWEKNNVRRYKNLINRAKNNYLAHNRISERNVRYILLHTIAHLMIRELTLRCGYTSASIKEKIYSTVDEEKKMCGILIYTASADSDGSLGGLARQGVPEKMQDILLHMLESASWCSNDPICIDSKNQGFAALNYGACHACSLLPETSCECSNILLDRGAIIGTSDEPSLGYFSEFLQ